MKIIEITLLFLGSIIGAGFATGAEIITFFGNISLPVWCISIIVGLAMFSIILLEILLYYPKQTETKVIKYKKKQTWLRIINISTVIIYFILFTAMTAGVTSITNYFVTIISLVCSAFIVLFGFDKLSHLNTYIVFLIIILITSTALPYLNRNIIENLSYTSFPRGIFWGVLYAGLNCFMFPELIKAASKFNKRSTLIWSSFFTSVIVTILVGLILTTIKTCQTTYATIPLLAAVPKPITIIIILLAILTSQYTALFAIVQRCERFASKTKCRPPLIIAGICLCAFIFSFFGFTQIISFAYPLIGAITCVFLLISWLKTLQL